MDDRKSIDAYDLPARVASYDADMDVMHPNRRKMVEIMLEVLPSANDAPATVLDLGVGTGFVAQQLLKRFPRVRVVAVDGAPAMIDLARTRLADLASRVDFHTGDFRKLREIAAARELDAVVSAFSLHHLSREDKFDVVSQAVELLRPGGWFVNADIVVADSATIEARIQEIRAAGIVARAAGRDDRFKDIASTQRYIAELQRTEGDQPLKLQGDLQVMREAGLWDAAAVWLEYREAVCAGRKRG